MMLESSKTNRYTLQHTLAYIAKNLNSPVMNDYIVSKLHSALCDGTLVAEADYLDNEKCERSIQSMAPYLWREHYLDSFKEIVKGKKFAGNNYAYESYTNPTIAVSDIDNFLSDSNNLAVEKNKQQGSVSKNVGGAPPKFDIMAFTNEVIRIADLDGLDNKRALKTKMLDWCTQKWNEQPSEKWVREKISELCPHLPAQ